MGKRRTVTQERLKEVLKYNQDTGIFTRITNTSNSTNVGEVVGCYHTKDGYHKISINNERYLSHRLAFLYMEGYLPENQIDHINGDNKDNRWCNLREVSCSCNLRNSKLSKNNKSGVKGVNLNKRGTLYITTIGVNNEQINLGNYKSKIDAVKARLEAEKKYNYPDCQTASTAYLYLKDRGLL